jgi:hypothetical protein
MLYRLRFAFLLLELLRFLTVFRGLRRISISHVRSPSNSSWLGRLLRTGVRFDDRYGVPFDCLRNNPEFKLDSAVIDIGQRNQRFVRDGLTGLDLLMLLENSDGHLTIPVDDCGGVIALRKGVGEYPQANTFLGQLEF